VTQLGGGGIRTQDTGVEYTRFASGPLHEEAVLFIFSR
jgi:hypothetical protein